MTNWIGAVATTHSVELWATSAGHDAAPMTVPLPPGSAPLSEVVAELAARLPGKADRPIILCGAPGVAPHALPCRPFEPGYLLPAGPPRLWLMPALELRTPYALLPATASLQLAGCLAADPGFDGVICLTDATSVWAELSAGEVVSATILMSGALAEAVAASPAFAALPAGTALSYERFDADLAETLSRPERLLRLLADAPALPAAEARARLHAALIGAELAAARPWWLGQRLRVLGPQAALYLRALAAQGVQASEGSAKAALLAGFALAARSVAP
ncbi:2-dehydro-3-deoxygalactonokinase [Phaeovulum sp.]|uniref:2-dehydro-3-deoxygalactonokinase n=1 Tax=Phaeovulum sp. TaxID=2934796 RepID=UPI00356A16E1